ncbi:MAG: hypothetical protein ACI4NP_02610 [Thermoguttaceae bacterium]
MTSLEKFMSLPDKERESFLTALYLFSELDATYRQMMKQSNFNADVWNADATPPQQTV